MTELVVFFIFTKEKNFELQIKEGRRGSDLSRLSVGSVSVVACMHVSVFCGKVWVLVAVGRLQYVLYREIGTGSFE